MSAVSLSFASTAPEAKSTAPYVAVGGRLYRKPIVVATPDWERNRLANDWTWNNLKNGTNNLANPNPFGDGNSKIWNWY